MTEVVINNCYGGFSLSTEACNLYKNLTGKEINPYGNNISRHDKVLVSVVKQLGEKANGKFASLSVETITDKGYHIFEYDGVETLIDRGNDNDFIEVNEND